ncbi:MAG: hypothetical protein M3552_13410, partial [Planctomycetota bacterium]|nr:hypothetical protein [Planctomycetota bacterium]
MRTVFLTVTDANFFLGTLATVNSVLEFHPDASVVVVVNSDRPLTTQQSRLLKTAPQVQLATSEELTRGRHNG